MSRVGVPEELSPTGYASVVELVGSPHSSSRTWALAEAVRSALTTMGIVSGHNHEVLELSQIVGVSFTAQPIAASVPHADPFTTVRRARLLIVASPAYKGTYTGLLKVFLDQLPRDALAGTVAIPVVLAASRIHEQTASEALSALLRELGASVPAVALTANAAKTSLTAAAIAWARHYATAVAESLNQRSSTAA
ncbi:NAD(P)H-dependent oxidoreductase [Actinoplanes sp. TBRC 11911]|uniref:NADPH-dependent FMN reductase n=1 Tax=Actinoplanes sp. TBRC 11911 TaxID=2729386 RepID=UPI00145E30D5|nr:NAD(P)H-dependent oxidoreductase [Actinoplanes sp. TBRC 11911]NMO57704.1 NAD(P)H-dependent oxidoreductase [Actinoplanes sp. TBRC 11911]